MQYAAKWMQYTAGLAVGSLAGAAHACPVCFAAKDEASRQAFFDSTIFLTLLPVAMIGGVIYWIARRSRQLAAEEPPEPEAPDAGPRPAAR